MAPGSRTSSPREVDLSLNPKSQPCRPRKNEDSVDCHPWDSRGRRLFPQRRTSIPTSVRCNMNATLGSPTFEWPPSADLSHVDHEGHIDHEGSDSRTSSPSSVDSVATVKVHRSPDSHWPSPATNPRSEEDAHVGTPCLPASLPVSCSVEPHITPHKSSNKSLETSFCATLYTDAPARSNLRWKSMAQFHESRHRPSPGVLSQLPNGEQVPCDSDESRDPLVPTNDTFQGNLSSKTGPCQWSQSPKSTPHTSASPVEVRHNAGREEDTYVIARNHSRRDVRAIEMAIWDCTVKMSTVATVAGNGDLHVHHLALLSVIVPMEALYVQKVSLSFIVSNALRADCKCSLGLGQSSLLFKEDISHPDFFPCEGAELTIICDSCELEKPLNLYFAFTYSSPWHSVVASLPTFRPKEGRLLSEVVFIAEPQPPLSMRTYTRCPLSSWRLCHHPVNQVTCYERNNVPRLYPADLQDDIEIGMLELEPVRFRALEESTLARVVWKLDITIYGLPEAQIECRMSFFIEVGVGTALLSLISHSWVPQYFIIDGCVATENAGECWQNKEGYITIFKQAHMGPGPIMVETFWRGPPRHDVHGKYKIPLPRVADRQVLGGTLTCPAHEIILLNHLGESLRPYRPVNGTYTRLPAMDTGYRILLKRAAEARAHKIRRPVVARRPCLPIPKHTQLSERTVISPDAAVEKGRHGSDLSQTANSLKEVAAPRQRLLQPLLLPLFILLLLVSGFLRFVEHARKGNNHSERISWRDRDILSRDGEGPQTIIDAAGSEALEPAIVAVDNPVEVAKCEGWRDWVDYGSGWKGCVP